MKDLSIVVPVYKEEKNIRPFLSRVEPIMKKIGTHEIIFCLDPSPDQTEKVIHEEIKRNPNIRLLVFSRKFGQPAATIAGIEHCVGQSCVVIDVDLQDPPELIDALHQKLQEGFDVVYATRRSRQGETFLKRIISWFGYKVMNKVSEVPIPRNTGDFRIINRRVIDELKKLPEKNSYLRGLVGFVGFKQTAIYYDRDKRAHGKGHYNANLGSLKIAINGLVSYSNFFLALSFIAGATLVGLALILLTLGALGWISLQFLLMTCLLLLVGGVQLIALGIAGEYIGRIYDEVKGRPRYIVEKKINMDGSSV